MIAGVHGLADPESSGFLMDEKCSRAEELVNLLVDRLQLGP